MERDKARSDALPADEEHDENDAKFCSQRDGVVVMCRDVVVRLHHGKGENSERPENDDRRYSRAGRRRGRERP